MMTNSLTCQFGNNMHTKDLIKKMRSWVSDFTNTTPANLDPQDSGSTFEEDAFQYLQEAILKLEAVQKEGHLKCSTLDLFAWLVELSEIRKAVIPSDTRNDLRKAIDQLAGLIKEANEPRRVSGPISRP